MSYTDKDGYEIKKTWADTYEVKKNGILISSGHRCELDARKAESDHRRIRRLAQIEAKNRNR